MAQITVGGTGDDDDDELARRIIAILRTTTDADCYWSLLEDVLKAALGEGQVLKPAAAGSGSACA